MEADNPDAVHLLVGIGGHLPMWVAEHYGLVNVSGKPNGKKAITGPPAHKAILFPPENKRSKKR